MKSTQPDNKRLRPLLKRVIWLFVLASVVLVSGCGGKKIFRKNPNRQSWEDQTREFFAFGVSGIQTAGFGFVNRDGLPDLILLRKNAQGIPKIQVWLNEESKKFNPVKRVGWQGKPGDRITHMAVGDLDNDRISDVVLVGQFSDGRSAQLLFNNGKGYFYERHQVRLPSLPAGTDRIDIVDLDQDGHRDLFVYGSRGKVDSPTDRYTVRLLLNDGSGRFSDSTDLLMPPLPRGMIGSSFADYDGDAVVDAFLIYANGRNRLLINNGHGRMSDRTKNLLPFIRGKPKFADWADFDQDGDNDLLVVNSEIDPAFRSSPGEYSYTLVNDGRGYFKKGSLQALPELPSHAVYLLDANDSDIPDILILSQRGTHFLRGKGKWQFWKESRKRLPRQVVFKEMVFSDVDNDGHLDIFGVTAEQGRGLLWMNTFR